jgi:hypothetical protein
LEEFSAGGGSGASAGINFMKFIGTKFSIWGGNYKNSIKNTFGETLREINYRYYYIPEGREKTDFNFNKIVFTFIDNNHGRAFEMIFEVAEGGLLKSTNI